MGEVPGSVTTWTRPADAIRLFVRGCTVRTAAPTALVVGTVLSGVNQGAIVVDGQATLATWLRIAVNYVVPFLVASVGYLSARRAPLRPGSHGSGARE